MKWTLILALILATPSLAQALTITMKDPRRDDKGTGKYVYPTSSEYKKGAFDITRVEISDKGSDVEFKVQVRTRITDPWDSTSWGGNGFSLQMAQIYIDKDHVGGSGYRAALPGMNVQFKNSCRWEKVVILSPQPISRLKSEISLKAAKMKADIVIPQRTYARGRWLIGIVRKADLGGGLKKSWGFQVLMQSNEGYPSPNDLLTRQVNEYEGPHRFGGGNDYNCDPHVIDMLAGKARGRSSEKRLQYKILKKHRCSKDKKKYKLARIPMIYPGH